MTREEWKHVPFSEAVADKTACGNKLQQKFFQPQGKVPIVDQGSKAIAGFSDDAALAWKQALPVVIFGDHTRAIKYVDYPFILGADGTKVLVPRNGLSAKFLYYYFHKVNLPSQGYARHFSHLKRIEVPVPPLAEQERIVALLDEADELRKLRTKADRRTADLIPALFHEMFGDVGASSMWPLEPFGNLATIEAMLVDPQKKEFRDLPHIGPDRIEQKSGKLLQSKSAREDGLISAKFLFDERDVLYSKIRPNLRKAAVPERRGLCSADMYPVRPGTRLVREFLWAYLLTDYFTARAVELSARANMPKLNRIQLDSISVPVPPLQLQQEFAQRVTESRAMEVEQAASRQRLEDFFQSMLHRAFAGELC